MAATAELRACALTLLAQLPPSASSLDRSPHAAPRSRRPQADCPAPNLHVEAPVLALELLARLEDLLHGARDDARRLAAAQHGERLAAARLAVRKDAHLRAERPIDVQA
jgi:hypothetical protein